MNRVFAICLSFLMLAEVGSAADFSVKESVGEHVEVLHKGRVLTRLMTARDDSTRKRTHETYKVYMHVIDPLDPEGKRLITKGPGGQYTHHRGIFIGWSKMTVGDQIGNWWQCTGDARQAYTGIISQEAGDDKIVLAVGVEWKNGDVVVLTEVREFTIFKPDAKGSFMIEKKSSLTAVAGDAELNGNPDHGGCQFRPSGEVSKNKSAKYLVPGNVAVGKARDLPWAAETFKLGDNDYLIQHLSDPGLPKGTRYSAYRNYGRFGAFPVDKIAMGETKSYRFGFYISTGTLPDDEVDMQKRWNAFAGK